LAHSVCRGKSSDLNDIITERRSTDNEYYARLDKGKRLYIKFFTVNTSNDAHMRLEVAEYDVHISVAPIVVGVIVHAPKRQFQNPHFLRKPQRVNSIKIKSTHLSSSQSQSQQLFRYIADLVNNSHH